MIKYVIAVFIFSLIKAENSLDLNTKTNLAIYWGQNSYGGQNLNQKEKYEKDIDFYCDDHYTNNGQDIIMLSFLNNFNTQTKKLPEINVANHCEDFYEEGPTYLHKCHHIGEGIKKCQKKKKTIILSLGGASASTGFTSEASAIEFANSLWNMYFGGNHKYRPFGDAVFDGVDLDIEGGSTDYYDVFVDTLRTFFKSDTSKKYYITAAPQCVFPDASLHKVMNKAHFDMIFIQFYNNWCGVQNFRNVWAWNWDQWTSWAQKESPNKDVKLFLGVPAARTAAGSGYVQANELENIIRNVSQTKQFGGVMMWDASQSENNLVNGLPYATHIKEFMMRNIGNSPKIPKQPSNTFTSSSTSKHEKTSTSSKASTLTSSSSETTTKESKTTSTYTPLPTQPAKECPIDKNTCSINGAFSCNGNEFAVCDNNKWVLRKCPSGTTCISNQGGVHCNFGNTEKCG